MIQFDEHIFQMGGKKPPTSHAWLFGIQGEVSVTSGWRLDFLADFAIPYEISDGLVPWRHFGDFLGGWVFVISVGNGRTSNHLLGCLSLSRDVMIVKWRYNCGKIYYDMIFVIEYMCSF